MDMLEMSKSTYGPSNRFEGASIKGVTKQHGPSFLIKIMHASIVPSIMLGEGDLVLTN